jgi:hypothetical protein
MGDAIRVRGERDGIGAGEHQGGVEQDVAVVVARLHLLHRPSNVDNPETLKKLCAALKRIAADLLFYQTNETN